MFFAQFNTTISDGLVINSRAEVSTPRSNVNPYCANAILHAGTFQVLALNGSQPKLILLSSSLAPHISSQLAAHSVPGVLNIAFQQGLNEDEPLQNKAIVPAFGSGAFGNYLRETFFHIPFLIANHLNSQQRFSEAQQWYHYIFNPMDIDNPWQYREFSTLTVESVRKMLTNEEALEAYRQNPFNPHAIARTRLSAYQKSIVMKYIDNLLDWGDRLFTQFTMESVNEATMLYILASDILGERPAQLPRCMEEKTRTYAQIRPSLSDVSDFLIEEIEQLEQIVIHPWIFDTYYLGNESNVLPRVIGVEHIDSMQLRSAPAQFASEGLGFSGDNGTLRPDLSSGGMTWTSTDGISLSELSLGNAQVLPELTTVGSDSLRYIGGDIDFDRSRYMPDPFANEISGPNGIIITAENWRDIGKLGLGDVITPAERSSLDVVIWAPTPQFDTVELVSAKNVFCFPQNEELLGYWSRVEDRLSKIRNCKDIAGVRRQLDLFSPEIDPRELIRLKAAGLSLEDVMDITSGHAPPYRFTYLIEKTRQYANAVQSLGGQLLAALEKRDAEELAAMRSVHEQQLLEMRTQLMRWELNASNDTLEGLNKQQEAIEYRKEHYENLVANGLLAWEQAQSAATISANTLSSLSAVHDIAASIAGFLPQIHSPTITGLEGESGGKTASEVLARISSSFKTAAGIADRVGGLAGMQAGFQRREEEWKHQITLAVHDLAQIKKQIEGAEIRVSIAERSLEIHDKSIEQAKEVYDFYRNKFSKHGLYTWMSTQLHRMHRLAFNTTWSMARMVEKALHFERPDLRDTVTLGAPAWDAGHAGLLSGEKLLLDLQRLEMRYLETNYRELEIEQAFSLALFSPDNLLNLQTQGECDFSIPEFFFDLHYPGHYRRRIKSVRLTIPCVIGPYNNVGATLTLTRSELRDHPLANDPLKTVPLRYAPTIAASSAQNDAGVFEFNFRDERYMPFEGMGAISTWTLRLPKTVRSFNYKTISDVILRINYTALEDSNLRDEIETINGSMLARFKEAAPVRMFSIRHDFPTIWGKFKNAQPNASNRCEFKLNLKTEDYPFWVSYFVENAFDASLIISADANLKTDIIAYKMGIPPVADTTGSAGKEATDIIEAPNREQGEIYHQGLLSETKPSATIGEWIIYFDLGDRDQINDLWLAISW